MNLVWICVFAILLLKISKYSAEESDGNVLDCKLDSQPLKRPCRWTNGIVPYRIQGLEFTTAQEGQIKRYIDDWNRRIPEIQFVHNAEYRYKDYVTFMNGTGCWSKLGRMGGKQLISLDTRGCIHPSLIQHEMMHAVGFFHEHSRHNRDQYVKIQWENIPEEWRSNYKEVGYGIFVPNELAEYEYYSIIHYPLKLLGKTTMKVLKNGVDARRIGHPNVTLTQLDVYKIRQFYKEKITGGC